MSRETKREEGGGSHRREEGCDFFSICLSHLSLKLELLFPQFPIAIFNGKKKGVLLEMLLGTTPSMFYLVFSPTSNPSTASTGQCPSSGYGTPAASEVASPRGLGTTPMFSLSCFLQPQTLARRVLGGGLAADSGLRRPERVCRHNEVSYGGAECAMAPWVASRGRGRKGLRGQAPLCLVSSSCVYKIPPFEEFFFIFILNNSSDSIWPPSFLFRGSALGGERRMLA